MDKPVWVLKGIALNLQISLGRNLHPFEQWHNIPLHAWETDFYQPATLHPRKSDWLLTSQWVGSLESGAHPGLISHKKVLLG